RVIYLFEPDSFVPAAKLENRFEAVHTRSGTGAVLYTEHQPTEPTLYSIHTDHLGTPMELAGQDGQLAWVGHYRAWGKLTKASDGHGNPSTTDNPLRFQGQYLDEETGLHYNRHRYYDPETGRFTTQDPIGLAGGENLYMYAPNPTGWVDPLGLSSRKECNCQLSGSVLNSPRTGNANKLDEEHAFPDIVDNYSVRAQRFDIETKAPGGTVDRISELRQVEGSLNGKEGVFEWIVDRGNVTHRRFIAGGTVTGFPNQTPSR
ncbi:MAG: hypothetical protein GYB17_06835, partial [Gammaproteobacteria bacterium]|nr:hypothetical protein [Gammaproteobacteria bacterium]